MSPALVRRARNDGGAARHRLLRVTLVLLCLLSLTFQGYLTQTHFHAPHERHVVGQDDPSNSKRPASGTAGTWTIVRAGSFNPTAGPRTGRPSSPRTGFGPICKIRNCRWIFGGGSNTPAMGRSNRCCRVLRSRR